MKTKTKKSKLILFYPKSGIKNQRPSFGIPYSVLSLAALLKERWEVKIIDNNLVDIKDAIAYLTNSLDECICVGIIILPKNWTKE